jgi:hypothetical protein|eukprot:COSAG02_NODE_1303_length_13357_cov_5.431287_8_plen_159_part_00
MVISLHIQFIVITFATSLTGLTTFSGPINSPELCCRWCRTTGGKAPPTGRESPLKNRPRTGSVGSQGSHSHSYGPSKLHGAGTDMEENPPSLPKQSMPLAAPAAILGAATPGTMSRELGETPIQTPQRPSRRAREPGRGGNTASGQHDSVEAPSAMSE